MQTIFEFMSHDHDRLDAILAEFLRTADADKALGLFAQFDTGLRMHIDWEEQLLFPPFEDQTGMRDSGPTAVMRMEHQQIKQQLQAIRAAIGQSTLGDAVQALLAVLTAHNHKEESILYPWLDQALPQEQTHDLLVRITGSQTGA